MSTFWLIAQLTLWVLVSLLGFLLLGILRALGDQSRRLETQEHQLRNLAATALRRDGLRLGKKAPAFTLPWIEGGEKALHDFAGQKILLVLLKIACAPCRHVIPELHRLHKEGEVRVLLVATGEMEAVLRWAREVGACFPVLVQDQHLKVCRLYDVFAMPFAFLINDEGVIRSKGYIGRGSEAADLRNLLSGAGLDERPAHGASEAHGLVTTNAEEVSVPFSHNGGRS